MMRRTLARSTGARLLNIAESIVLFSIAVVLVALAVVVLANGVRDLIDAFLHGEVAQHAIEILDSVLLVMMTMEIVYTVSVSLEQRRLVAEPFLVIGSIAAIRRMLIITAESTTFAVSNPAAFQATLFELGLLALIVIAMAASIYIIRRSHRFLHEGARMEGEEERQR